MAVSKLIALLTTLITFVTAALPVVADEPAAHSQTAKQVTLNSESLKKYLLSGNTNVLAELNQVHRAKDQVAAARGALLPRLNLSALLMSAFSPTFALSSVDFMLPFLVPSNWGNYKKSKDLFSSEQVAYEIVEANQFASAYSLFYTIAFDRQVVDVLKQTVDSLKKIENAAEWGYKLGTVSLVDYERAQGETQMAQLNLSAMQDLITQESAALKHALGLDPESEIVYAPVPIPPSDLETLSVDKAVEKALPRSLEAQQLVHMIAAAKKDKWNQTFSFITGDDVRTPQTFSSGAVPATPAFNKLMLSSNFSIGFDYFPNIRLSQRNIDALMIRGTEIKQELGEVLESALGRFNEAKLRQDTAVGADKNWKNVFDTMLMRYQLGTATLVDVMLTVPNMVQAQAQRIKADMDVNLIRITLHRAMMTDAFATLPPAPKDFPKPDKKKKK